MSNLITNDKHYYQMKVAYITLTLMLGFRNYPNPLATPDICYVYKIQYDGNKITSRALIAVQYFNIHMDVIREIAMLPGGHTNDTCDTEYKYDLHHHKTSELTKCSGGKIVSLIQRDFTYGQAGRIEQELSIQDQPYFECYRVTHLRDSVIKSFYSDKRHLTDDRPIRKDIDVSNNQGRTILTFSRDSNGAASNVHFFLYRRLSDTNKSIPDLNEHFGLNSTGIEKEVHYYNALGNDERVDFSHDNLIMERSIIKYNLRNKIMSELDFSFPKNKYVLRTTYHYNNQGALTEKTEEDIENELTKKYIYRNGLVVRQEYVYNGRLDHAIEYSYKSISH
jgi:hypothetical protein